MQAHLDQFHASDPSLAECIKLFLADLELRVETGAASWRTLATYSGQLKKVSPELLARPVGAIRRPEVRAWHRELANRRGRGGRRLTGAADNILKTLGSVFAFVIDHDLAELDTPPTLRIKHVHEKGGARALNDVELADWRDALAVHEHYRTQSVRTLKTGHRLLIRAFNPTVALRLLDLTGARSSEIRELRIEHIDLVGRKLFLPRTKTDAGKARPLSHAAVAEIRLHLARLGNPTEGFLFPSRVTKHGCMSDACLIRCFNRVAAVAGLRNACRHSLRHTMVTRGLASGFSTTGTSGAAGHDKLMSFKDYRHAVPGEAFAVVEAHALRPKGAA